MFTLVLRGSLNADKDLKFVSFLAQALGYIEDETCKLVEDETHELLLNGNKLDSVKAIIDLLDDGSLAEVYAVVSKTEILTQTMSDDSLELLNDKLASLETTFTHGEEPKFCDLVYGSLINIWIAESSSQAKSKLRALTAFYSKLKKTKNFEKSVTTNTSSAKSQRSLADPTRWKLVVGKVLSVWEHPNSDKLWCEEIDIGEDKPRLIGSGLRKFVAKEDFENKLVIVLANMKPKNLGGFNSHGMVVCASTADHSKVELLVPGSNSKVGDVVNFENLSGEPDKILSSRQNNDTISNVMKILKTDFECVAFAGSSRFLINNQIVKSATIANGLVG